MKRKRVRQKQINLEDTAIASLDIETCKILEIDGEAYNPVSINSLSKAEQEKANKNVLVYSCQCMFVRRCDMDKFDRYCKNYTHCNNRDIAKAMTLYEPEYCRAGSLEDGIKWFEARIHKYGIKDLTIWVHNLSYEGEYLLRMINRDSCDSQLRISVKVHNKSLKEDIFALDSHELVRLGVNNCMTFKCSYKLTNQSLKKCGKDVGIPKGDDYDYDKFHLPTDRLTPEEELYCYNDVLIVCAKIRQLEIQRRTGLLPTSKCYEYHTDFPMTTTGFVREDARRALRSNEKNITWFKSSKLNYEEFIMCKEAFMGGDTHANFKYVGKTLENCDSFDIGSSYPYAMLTEQFPYGKAVHMENLSYRELQSMLKAGDGMVAITRLVAKNIRAKHDHHLLSKSKCIIKSGEPVIDNGRIVELKGELYLTCTNIDLADYLMFYDIESIVILDAMLWNKAYLPIELRHAITVYYGLKQKLKGVKGEELNYAFAKETLNSFYGMMVQNPLNDECVWDYETNEWKISRLDYTKEAEIAPKLEKFYESKSSFLPYQVGVFVTAYARHNLHTLIYNISNPKLRVATMDNRNVWYRDCDNFVYCDTDSTKVRNVEEVLPMVEQYNAKVKIKIDRYYNDLKEQGRMDFDRSFFDNLGIFDWETRKHQYRHFITLGAKKYCTHTDEGISMTVSGLAKSAVTHLKNWEELETAFRAGTVFDEDTSGRTVSYYVDNTMQEFGKGGVYIENTTYTLGLSKEFLAYLKRCEITQKPVRTLYVTKKGIEERETPVDVYLSRLMPEVIEELIKYIQRGDAYFIVGEL